MDNIWKLLLLNGVERLISASQAASNIGRTGRPNTTSFLFTEIMNDGAFRGTLRGLSMSLLQASLVLWPSVYLTNKKRGGATQFIGSYLLFDALLYPLDTIKNIMYANTVNPLNIRQALSQVSLVSAYRGLPYRLAFNIPFAATLYTSATNCEWTWAFWLATVAAYPLNSIKVNLQTSGKQSANYRGVLPFALITFLCNWQLSALATSTTL